MVRHLPQLLDESELVFRQQADVTALEVFLLVASVVAHRPFRCLVFDVRDQSAVREPEFVHLSVAQPVLERDTTVSDCRLEGKRKRGMGKYTL